MFKRNKRFGLRGASGPACAPGITYAPSKDRQDVVVALNGKFMGRFNPEGNSPADEFFADQMTRLLKEHGFDQACRSQVFRGMYDYWDDYSRMMNDPPSSLAGAKKRRGKKKPKRKGR